MNQKPSKQNDDTANDQGRPENSRDQGQNYIWRPYNVIIFKQQKD